MSVSIAEVLARVDLVALVERYAGGPVRSSGGRVTFHCPHPDHQDRHPSFTVENGRFRCWSQCEASGDAADLLVWLEGITTAEALARLGDAAGITTRTMPGRPGRRSLERFAKARGWNPAVIDELGLTGVVDDFGRPRIRFPFTPEAGYWQDRAMADAGLRWLSPKGRPIPYPYQAHRLARAHETGEVVVVEGITDAVAMLSAWPDGAVLGTPGAGVFKPAWAAPLRGLRIYAVADNDGAGAKLRHSLDELFGPAVQHVMVPEAFHDLDEWQRGAGGDFPVQFYVALGMDPLEAAATVAADVALAGEAIDA